MTSKTFTMPIVHEHQCDVFIAGGGPAGLGAALAASRCGAKTVLVEQTGCLGGMGTAGMVPAFAPLNYNDKAGIPLIRGVLTDILDELNRESTLFNDYPGYGRQQWWLLFDKERSKLVFDRMLNREGVAVQFFSTLCGVEMNDRRIVRAMTLGKDGLHAWTAKCFVDATGDADLAFHAGVPCVLGDDAGQTMPPTLCFSLSGIDRSSMPSPRAPYEAMARGKADGSLRNPDDHRGEKDLATPDAWLFNYNHVYGVDCLTSQGLTQAMVEGRATAFEFLDYLRKTVPGFSHAYMAATAPLVGVRETRRIRGQTTLTRDAYSRSLRNEDDVCVYDAPIDLHAVSAERKSQEEYYQNYYVERTKPGEVYGIPYRCLLPANIDNLIVAGRAISCDRAMLASVRQMTCCVATGQAAGVAAALMMKYCSTADVPVAELRRSLLSQGVFLP